MKVAALCAGYGGLELGLQMAGADVDLRWYAEIDKHASQVLAGHHPDVPNLGDLTRIVDPEPVDLIAAGFPCQPVSTAGKRKGVDDERWLIDDVCRVASDAGARWLVLENVPGIFTANRGHAFYQVLRALAEIGFAAEWVCVRASDVGAPHQRLRWFCVAYADVSGRSEQRWPVSMGTEQQTLERGGSRVEWGPYTDAIRRWEPVIGRPAPAPTDDQRQLNPRFVEWMMGLPDGWVCDHVDGRSHQLRILGNGVVPQQAAYAITHLINRMAVAS